MGKLLEIKGKTPDEKFKHLEVILNRMRRKLHRTVVGVMPPVPIMFATDAPQESGEIFSFLTPAKGMITDVCLLIREFTVKEPITFEAKVSGSMIGAFTKFSTRKNLTVQTIDLSVLPGDLLTLSTNNPAGIKGIWLSFLYQMGIDKAEQKKYLIDEFERIIEEENIDAED